MDDFVRDNTIYCRVGSAPKLSAGWASPVRVNDQPAWPSHFEHINPQSTINPPLHFEHTQSLAAGAALLLSPPQCCGVLHSSADNYEHSLQNLIQ